MTFLTSLYQKHDSITSISIMKLTIGRGHVSKGSGDDFFIRNTNRFATTLFDINKTAPFELRMERFTINVSTAEFHFQFHLLGGSYTYEPFRPLNRVFIAALDADRCKMNMKIIKTFILHN